MSGIAPAIRLVAFEQRAGYFIFVAVPNERGRYLRTDRSVVLVACPLCDAIKGEPCKGKAGYGGATHARRRQAAKAIKGRQDDLIEPVDIADPGLPSPLPEPEPPLEFDIDIRRREPLTLLADPKPFGPYLVSGSNP